MRAQNEEKRGIAQLARAQNLRMSRPQYPCDGKFYCVRKPQTLSEKHGQKYSVLCWEQVEPRVIPDTEVEAQNAEKWAARRQALIFDGLGDAKSCIGEYANPSKRQQAQNCPCQSLGHCLAEMTQIKAAKTGSR